MRDREEGKPLSVRRAPVDDSLRLEDEAEPLTTQSLATLREGYSWVRELETRHPGWKLHPVEGFEFALPKKKVAQSRICLISFAGVYRKGQKPFNTSPSLVPPHLRSMRFRGRGDWSMREIPVNWEASDLAIAHAHYDHSDADEDINCVFPLARLRELELEECIGSCAEVHYSMMGYAPDVAPILNTTTRDILPRLRNQEVDAVVVSGGCELSHQTGALIQRSIEAAGIPTVSVSTCPDITYRMLVPRAVVLRFPLGNPFGAPMDAPMQARILKDALLLLDSVQTPGEVITLPYEWIKL
jgi:glycine/betaine/sarcosine/D-proline reductase family selenoprotein B